MKKLLHLFLAVVCASALSVHAEVIRIRGSDTLGARLVPQLCELYMVSNPGITFEITAEGSSSGFASLLDDAADIAMSSREPDEEETRRFTEQGISITRRDAAVDAFVLAVNAGNPLDGLTAKQVEAIFTGDVTRWVDVGGQAVPISIYPRNPSSGSSADFQQLAMHGRPYAKSASPFGGGESIVQRLVRNEHGITYIGLGDTQLEGIKVLAIDGHQPTVADRGTYPYFRNCCYFTRKAPGAAVSAFIEWATRSEDARKLITKIGFLPPV